jgi:CRISPR-associated endonuclease/helicase Cas3
MQNLSFDGFFKIATGNEPFPYQRRLALSDSLPMLVDVPTGMGKTAAAVMGWLWRRYIGEGIANKLPEMVKIWTPRRLVYCLPMRVLVEQTRDEAIKWVQNLVRAGLISDSEAPKVYMLMGGEVDSDWDIYPERNAILIGTQDQLLSRALNRGYAMSRYRWPVHFGLLNNDCLWIMDEVQIFGAGLLTTTQLQAFRNNMGTFAPVHSVWMSATLHPDWLKSIDFKDKIDKTAAFVLDGEDKGCKSIAVRLDADKPILKATTELIKETAKKYAEAVAKEVIKAHQSGALTLLVINRVDRAKEIFRELRKATAKSSTAPELLLLHSRFRPAERKGKMRDIFSPIPANGRIVVATQVVEAGVDISAKVLFTELAPWASLVQRFGRCNRKGECLRGEARIYWINIDASMKDADFKPYEIEELENARKVLEALSNAGPKHLKKVEATQKINHVIRRRDLVDLFDTTPDLAGNDVDVSRYIRDGENIDVHIFWRSWDDEAPPQEVTEPSADELCPVPVYAFKEFLKGKDKEAWRWNGLDGAWERVRSDAVYPGQEYLLHQKMGGYEPDLGWDKDDTAQVLVLSGAAQSVPDKTEADYDSNRKWQILKEHDKLVGSEIKSIVKALGNIDLPSAELEKAAVWHDSGKAHVKFQEFLCGDDEAKMKEAIWAKAPFRNRKHKRPYFRHELASGLAALQNGQSDLVAYLAAAHHGKVRLSIRSLPGEKMPDDSNIRFARGIWEGDELLPTELADGVMMNRTVLDLEPMEMGTGKNGPSWFARTLKLRDVYGPFRLAYLEALLKAADERGSKEREGGHE